MSESQRLLSQAWGISAHNNDLARAWVNNDINLGNPRAWVKCRDFDIPKEINICGTVCRIFPSENGIPRVYQCIGRHYEELPLQEHMCTDTLLVYLDNSRQFYLTLMLEVENGTPYWGISYEMMPETDPRSDDSVEL